MIFKYTDRVWATSDITLRTAAIKPTISSAVACLNGWLYWLSKPNSSMELNKVPMLAASPRL